MCDGSLVVAVLVEDPTRLVDRGVGSHSMIRTVHCLPGLQGEVVVTPVVDCAWDRERVSDSSIYSVGNFDGRLLPCFVH